MSAVLIETREMALRREGVFIEGGSIFALSDKTCIRTDNHVPMSVRTIAGLIGKSRYLDRRKLMIIQLLYEFGSLTAYALTEAMLSKKIPVEIRKTSAERNAYRKELLSLVHNGIIERHSVRDGEDLRLVFYRLAWGMRIFYRLNLSRVREPVYLSQEAAGIPGTASEHLARLASSMFCIRAALMGRLSNEGGFDAVIRTGEIMLCLITLRSPCEEERIRTVLLSEREKKENRVLLILCPDIDFCKEIYGRISRFTGYRQGRVVFTTDTGLRDRRPPVLYLFNDEGYSVVEIEEK